MLVGSLVRLRAPEQRDAEPLHRWMHDPVGASGLAIRYPFPLRVEREWIEQNSEPTPERIRFAVETHDGDLLGVCGLYKIDTEHRRAELGLALVNPTSRGQGYGTDTVRTLCRYGFGELGLHRIELLVFAHNAAARRVYEKAGFRVEGVARQAHWGEGRWYDDVHMSVIEGELT